MCFSATASFAASGGLATIGVLSLRLAKKKQILIALIPIFLALQQLLEGFQWFAIGCGQSNLAIGYVYIFFAFLLWPFYVPLMVLIFDQKRKWLLTWLVGVGSTVTFTLFILLTLRPLTIHVLQNSIHYQIYTPYEFEIALAVIYALVVCGSLLLSSKKEFRWFGGLLLVSAAIAATFFFINFVSVWCFFAALLSSLIYFYLRQEQTKKHVA